MQRKLNNDLKKIRNEKKPRTPAEKTANLYKVSIGKYQELMEENVQDT